MFTLVIHRRSELASHMKANFALQSTASCSFVVGLTGLAGGISTRALILHQSASIGWTIVGIIALAWCSTWGVWFRIAYVSLELRSISDFAWGQLGAFGWYLPTLRPQHLDGIDTLNA